jgi:hypothetical protein
MEKGAPGQDVMISGPWSTGGTCKCGACRVSQRHRGGLMTFRCHCKNCQKAYKDDEVTRGLYSFPTMDYCCNVHSEGPMVTTYTCSSPCPPSGACLARKNCERCNEPIVSWGLGSLSGLAFPNTGLLNKSLPVDQLIEPEMNIFYASREMSEHPLLQQDKVVDGMPTYTDAVSSFVNLLGPLAWRICSGRSCCCF